MTQFYSNVAFLLMILEYLTLSDFEKMEGCTFEIPMDYEAVPGGASSSAYHLNSDQAKQIPQSAVNLLSGTQPMIPSVESSSGLPPLKIQNVVSTVNLDCELDLQKVTCCTRNSEYNPKRFCGVIMRIFSPKCTALIFSSGKVVVTGVRHEEEAQLASRKFARIMQKLGFPVRFKNFRIHNMVATTDLKFPIRVENLHQKHGQFSSYEPELFPALIYRMIKPRVVLLIFVNGKIVITGAKYRQEIDEALTNILPILRSFKK